MAPLPPTVETTGASSRSARATRASAPPGGATDAAAGQDDRPLRGVEQSRRPRRRVRRGPDAATTCVGHGLHRWHVAWRSSSTSCGNLDPGGTGGRGLGERPRVGQQAGDLGGLADDGGALGDVGGAALLIVELVQHAPAQTETGARHLAGDDEQRHARRVRLLQRAECGQRTGSGGQEQHADFACGPGVSVGAERRVVLDARADEGQVAAPDRVEQAERVLAGDAEDVRNTQARSVFRRRRRHRFPSLARPVTVTVSSCRNASSDTRS